jgi:hypothetical protein
MTKNLIAFIDKVQTIEISTINGMLDLSRYRYGVTEEDEELKRLQQNALIELRALDSEAIKRQMMGLDQIKLRFEKIRDIWSDAATAFINGTLNEDDFIEQIKNNFLAPGLIPGRITQSFISDLQDAIMYKDGSLLGFIDQLPGHQEHDHSFISHLTIPDEKRQPFADGLKNEYSDLTGRDLAIMFYAAKEYIKLRNLRSLLEGWQRFIGLETKRDEAMNKAMRTLKSTKSYYEKELSVKTGEIQNIYKSIQ